MAVKFFYFSQIKISQIKVIIFCNKVSITSYMYTYIYILKNLYINYFEYNNIQNIISFIYIYTIKYLNKFFKNLMQNKNSIKHHIYFNKKIYNLIIYKIYKKFVYNIQ